MTREVLKGVHVACQVGLGWSAAIGSGLVVARQEGGGWSPPSAVSMYALGWGFQCGGALCDLLLVLHTKCALRPSVACHCPPDSCWALGEKRVTWCPDWHSLGRSGWEGGLLASWLQALGG